MTDTDTDTTKYIYVCVYYAIKMYPPFKIPPTQRKFKIKSFFLYFYLTYKYE